MKSSYLKPTILLFLTAVLILSIATSCASEKEDEPEVSLSDIHVSEYTIVRGDHSENEVLRQVLVLKNAIENRFGAAPTVSTDWSALASEEDNKQLSKQFEILVGVTSRSESLEINTRLDGKNGYVFCTVGNKIVITATTNALLEDAMERFIKEYLLSSKGYLPEVIDCQYIEVDTVYLAETPENRPVLYLPENASPVVTEAANRFTTYIKDLSGITVEIASSAQKHAVILTPSGGEIPAVEAYKGMGFRVREDGLGNLILQGEDEMALISSISALYIDLEDSSTKTLTGEARLSYSKKLVLRESDPPFFPVILGGSYLGKESVASNCSVYYFENVSGAEASEYYAFLEKHCGYKKTYQGSALSYQNSDQMMRISFTYDYQKQMLSVVAVG